jgi:hypothetical protein
MCARKKQVKQQPETLFELEANKGGRAREAIIMENKQRGSSKEQFINNSPTNNRGLECGCTPLVEDLRRGTRSEIVLLWVSSMLQR